MICSYCYKSQIAVKHDVGHWWNNPLDSVYVCSDKCYTELEKLVKDRTWMDYKPPRIFTKKKTIGAMTDKRFTEDLTN